MIVQLSLPQFRSGFDIQGVGVGAQIAEVGDVASTLGARDVDGGANAGAGFKGPVGAARGGVQGINGSSGAAHENATAGDGGLRGGAIIARESESPLQLEF